MKKLKILTTSVLTLLIALVITVSGNIVFANNNDNNETKIVGPLMFDPDSPVPVYVGEIKLHNSGHIEIENDYKTLVGGQAYELGQFVEQANTAWDMLVVSGGLLGDPDYDDFTDVGLITLNDVGQIKIEKGYKTLKAGQYYNLSDFVDEANTSFDYLIIKGEKRPAISGQEHFAENINNPKSINWFVSQFNAFDDIDGDLTSKIKIEKDNYTPNITTIGTYDVKLSVVDTAGNKSELIFYITLADIDAPVITGDSSITSISYDKTFDVEQFRKTLSVTDNYDSMTISDIILENDNYTKNKTKLGTYDVIFKATDSSNNTETFRKQIKVIDGVAPNFTGTKELIKSYTKAMSVADIIKDIKANDFIDGDVTNDIIVKTDNYTGNGNKVGVYQIILEVKDKAGNKATHTITVTVVDDKSPEWYITNGVTITLTPDATLSRQQIIDLLAKTGQIKVSAQSIITYSIDEYSDNIGNAGVYRLAFNVKEVNGSSKDYMYNINVLNEDDSDVDIIPTPDTIIDKVQIFFKSNWVYIATFGVVLLLVVGGYNKVQDNKRRRRRR